MNRVPQRASSRTGANPDVTANTSIGLALGTAATYPSIQPPVTSVPCCVSPNVPNTVLLEDRLKEVVTAASTNLLRELREVVVQSTSGVELRHRRRRLGEEVAFFDRKSNLPLAFIRGERTESAEVIAAARANRGSFSVFLDRSAKERFWRTKPDGSLANDSGFSFEHDYGRLLIVLLANCGSPLCVSDVWEIVHAGEEVADAIESLRKVIGYLGKRLGIRSFRKYVPFIDLPHEPKGLILPLFTDGALILGPDPSSSPDQPNKTPTVMQQRRVPVSRPQKGGLIIL